MQPKFRSDISNLVLKHMKLKELEKDYFVWGTSPLMSS